MFPLSRSLKKIKRHRLTSAAAWRDRLVMWTAAIVAGLCVVGFTFLTDWAVEFFVWLRSRSVLLPFLVTPLGAMLIVWLTRRFAPLAAGSGIPQVIASLEPSLSSSQTAHFVSLKISAAKALLCSIAIAVGFSTGREGPSVQIAAGVMYSFGRWFKGRAYVNDRDLILAGGAAGIAAAFNAPLAGIVFAIEELSRRFEQRSSGVILTAILLGGVVAISLQGNFTYFGHLNIINLSTSLLIPAMLCILGAGLTGGLFSRLLLTSVTGKNERSFKFKMAYPIGFAGICGLAIALLGFISNGAAHGSGYDYTQGVLKGQEILPFFYAGIKFIATWLSYWCGIPGGVFAPSLAIGAGLGNDIGLIFHLPIAMTMPLIAVGMVGFLAAVTQAPITAFVIVMEMIDGHTMVLSLMASALIASLISKLISPPLYHSLAQFQRQGLMQADENRSSKENGQAKTPAETEGMVKSKT